MWRSDVLIPEVVNNFTSGFLFITCTVQETSQTDSDIWSMPVNPVLLAAISVHDECYPVSWVFLLCDISKLSFHRDFKRMKDAFLLLEGEEGSKLRNRWEWGSNRWCRLTKWWHKPYLINFALFLFVSALPFLWQVKGLVDGIDLKQVFSSRINLLEPQEVSGSCSFHAIRVLGECPATTQKFRPTLAHAASKECWLYISSHLLKEQLKYSRVSF